LSWPANARPQGDGVLSVTPYYNKPTQEASTGITGPSRKQWRCPSLIYNVQGRTSVNVETATLARLAEIENIVGVKEASGNISQLPTSSTACPRFPLSLR